MKLMLKSMALLGLMSGVASADVDLLAGASDLNNVSVAACPTYDAIYNYQPMDWHAGIGNDSLSGHVSIQDSVLEIRIGKAASSTDTANWAAVKVDATQAGGSAPQSLTFNWQQNDAWGGTNFEGTIDVTVVGYNADGSSTKLQSWRQVLNGGTSNISTTVNSATIDLSSWAEGDFASYGVIVSSARNTAGDIAGGFAVSITDLTLKATPEPTTATLSLLALAGLCARRRRK